MEILDAFFIAITYLGDEIFLLLTLPIIYFARRKLGLKLSSMVLLGVWFTHFLKGFFKIERPPKESWKVEASGYSFPSGHSTNAAAYWGYLGYYLRKYRIVMAIFWAIAVLIGVSRVYLGVHRWEDIIGGFAVGIISILIVEYSARTLEKSDIEDAFKIIASLVIPVILILFTYLAVGGVSNEVIVSIKATGTLSGMYVGYILAGKYNVHLEDTSDIKQIGVRSVIGLSLVGFLFVVYKLFQSYIFMIAVTYWLMGLAIAFVAPYIIKRLLGEKS